VKGKFSIKSVLAIFSLLLLGCAVTYGATIPGPTVGDGLGVNIHFTGDQTRDLDMIRDAGFNFVRMDFSWTATERVKGVYDFSEYDKLVDGLSRRGLRALFILDYGNPLYDPADVTSDRGRQAFAAWAATAARRYRNKGIIWEIWNEPDGFWKEQPSLIPYMKLVKIAIPAIHKADPKAICMAPAISSFNFGWLEKMFDDGLLNVTDVVSVHGYRGEAIPESVEKDIRKLTGLMVRHRPGQPILPVVLSEWGYSSLQPGVTDEVQGEYVARMFLTNLSMGVPLSIWYDWRDDGIDPKNNEHHFGTVKPDYQLKPAYLAVKKLTTELKGMHFIKRMQSRSNEDYLMVFGDGKRLTIAAWTTGEPHESTIPNWRTIRFTAAPEYYPVEYDVRAILDDVCWTVVPRSLAVLSGAPTTDPLSPAFTIRVRNPLKRTTKISVHAVAKPGVYGRFVDAKEFSLAPGRSADVRWVGGVVRRDWREFGIRVIVDIGGDATRQDLVFSVVNPLFVGIEPGRNGGLCAAIVDRTRRDFDGEMDVKIGSESRRIRVKAQDHWKKISAIGPGGALPASVGNDGSMMIPVARGDAGVRVVLNSGGAIVAETGSISLKSIPAEISSTVAVNDGDPKVGARYNLEYDPSERALRLNYDYDAGWKFVRISPKGPLAIEGKPHEAGVWVMGDGSGLTVNMRFVDATGRTFQPSFGVLDFKGWRFLRAPMDDSTVSNWGGGGSVRNMTYPIRLDTFLLVDGNHSPVKGSVEMKDFTLFYRN
jgi:hypothetical protein